MAASGWTLPNGNQAGTRNVPSSLTSTSVKNLKKAWSVPIKAAINGLSGTYATTPVVVKGVVYTQDLSSNVYAINFKTGKLVWFKKYNSPDEGPNGVTVVNGVVYGATENSAFALQASTGEQLWKKKLTRNNGEGIDMAPGYNNGIVYVSTVPGNSKAFYAGDGQAILWAMKAKTGKTLWKWNEVPTNLWSDGFFNGKKNTAINSGGGQWEPPVFDKNGDLFLGVSNPAPFTPYPVKKDGKTTYPELGTTRPGSNLYTDSVVKLNHVTGAVEWYYQLVPHDVHDWDINNNPILETVNGKGVVLGGGKAGIAFALDEQTGHLLWKTPVGVHNGHDDDGLNLMTGKATPSSIAGKVYPGALGGIESPMASDGKTLFTAINNEYGIYDKTGMTSLQSPAKATGDLEAIDEATGKVLWDHKFKHSAYGAATVTNDIVFTTTYDGYLWALSKKSGKTVAKIKLPGGTNSPLAIQGDTVIAASSVPQSASQSADIVAYRLK